MASSPSLSVAPTAASLHAPSRSSPLPLSTPNLTCCSLNIQNLQYYCDGQVWQNASWRSGVGRHKWRGDSLRSFSKDGVEDSSVVAEENVEFDIIRLELYTERVKNEVLRVHAVVDGEEDIVLIFKGFSSSLTRSTASDPAEPVLPSTSTILKIDRIRGPYDPSRVLIIKGGRGLSWQQFQKFLVGKGL